MVENVVNSITIFLDPFYIPIQNDHLIKIILYSY